MSKTDAVVPEDIRRRWKQVSAAIEAFAYAEADALLVDILGRLSGPARIPFLTQRSRVLGPLGRQAEVVETVREALAILKAAGLPGDAATLHQLGLSLSTTGREAEALPILLRATTMAPQAGVYWKTRGETEEFLGLTDAAERSYEQAAATGNWAANLALARLKRWTADNNHVDRLLTMPVETELHQACKGYALFKEYDDIGDKDAAWHWLQYGAGAARRQPTSPRRPGWSAEDERAAVAAWRSAFPASRFATPLPSVASAGPRRIFVIGLPRSGTTLVERILGAHSQVRALGELAAFPAAVKTATGTDSESIMDAETVQAAAVCDPAVIAGLYARETAWLTEGAICVTDKLPHNCDYAGLIRLAFPDAALVHVRREPMDALFGAYKLYFAAGWSFSQDDLADHYESYRSLMVHWKDCLGDGLIEVSLGSLIADPEAEIRRLLAACDLPFEEACLSPHKATGAVSSASSSQVRKPINAEGVGAWQRYAAELEPLRLRLEAMGAVDARGNAI